MRIVAFVWQKHNAISSQGRGQCGCDNSGSVQRDQFRTFSVRLYTADSIYYFTEVYDGDISSVIFLVGGNKTPYHAILVEQLCDRYGLKQKQFIFDPPREIWNIRSKLFFFSDQKMQITHPMTYAIRKH